MEKTAQIKNENMSGLSPKWHDAEKKFARLLMHMVQEWAGRFARFLNMGEQETMSA
jgi:hypothetical protein